MQDKVIAVIVALFLPVCALAQAIPATAWNKSRPPRARISTHMRVRLRDGEGTAPGFPSQCGTAFLQRGVRADETESGSGLGLAIVSDLVDLYRGSLALRTARGGGLRVKLVLPRKASDGT